MSGITLTQNKRLHQLLSATNLMDCKADLVRQFTNERTSSSKEMSVDEARVLITHLSSLVPGFGNQPAVKQLGPLSVKDKRRRKVFALMYDIGYIYGTSPEDRKINSAVVNRLVVTYGVCKPKTLNDYTEDELIDLINQFESWKKNNEMAAISKSVRKEVAEVLGYEK